MAQAKDVGEALDAYEPHAEGLVYLALKAKLAEVRAGQRGSDKARIPNGPSLKIGMRDERVPLIRSRLDVAGEGSATYDKELADAVKKFQERHELKPTGTLDGAQSKRLTGAPPIGRPISLSPIWNAGDGCRTILDTYVIVNLPDYTLRVIRQDKQVWMTRIVVGKPATPTPIMSAQMKSITVNPTWNVPDSIAANEYLPSDSRTRRYCSGWDCRVQPGWHHSPFPTAG